MKIIFSGLLVICFLFMSACGSADTVILTTPPGMQPPPSRTSNVQATASPETSPEVIMIQLDPNDVAPNVIAAVAEYRIAVDGYEYYFDASKPVIEKELETGNAYPDFPLMKGKAGSSDCVFLGVYGYDFEIKNDYLYIDSGAFMAGDRESWTTRALSLTDGSVSEGLDSVELYFPSEGNTVYYIDSPSGNTIYSCDPDLTDIKEFPIELPDWETISENLKGFGYDETSEDSYEHYLYIKKTENGWIYFSDNVCYPPDLSAYMGDYRISLDGTKIENTGKIDEHDFTPLSNYENYASLPTQTAAVQVTASPATSPEEMISYGQYSGGMVEKCRTAVGGYEYYLDTSKPVTEKDLVDMYPEPDFPLMKKKTGDTEAVFLGVYGHDFEIHIDYLYITSCIFVGGDYQCWTTRALSLKDESVSGEILDAFLYFPPEGEGDAAYYVETPGDTIYCCEPDLTVIKEYPIHLPDIKNILNRLKTMGYRAETEDYFEYYINHIKIKDGWIYFTYEMSEPPQLGAYTGHYRIRLDGTKIERTGKGKYYKRSDYWLPD